MKKTIIACALLGAFTATSAQAAMILGFKAGGDYVNSEASGSAGFNGTAQQEFDFSSSAQGSVWLAAEHPVPLVPNVKIRENRFSSDGSLVGGVSTKTDLSNTDFILYYEILDNSLVSLDIGAAYKKMHGSFALSAMNSSSSESIDSGVVMGYVDAEVGVPGIGLYGFSNVMLGANESSVHDYNIGLGWNFDGVVLDYRVRAGYRDFNFDVNDFSGVSTDIQFKGAFAGIELVF